MTVAQRGDDTDALVWLGEQWWAPWVLFAGAVVVGLWMIRSLLMHRGRGHGVARAAAGSGMTYRAQDGFGLSRVRFQHFLSGDGRGWTATDVVTCEARDGARAHAFDARSWTEYDVVEDQDGDRSLRRRRVGESPRGRVKTVRKHQGSTRTAAMVPIPLRAPRLVVARENVASKLFAAATRLDLDLESEAFNRSYHVICDDRDFARAMLDARMLDVMVRTEGRISFEFVGGWALLVTTRIEPELFPGLARLAHEVRSVVPRLAIEGWPSAASGTGQDGLRATIL